MSHGQTRRSIIFDDHRISVGEICSRYGTNLRLGLSNSEAEARLAKNGKNILISHKKRTKNRLLFKRLVYITSIVRLIAILSNIFNVFLLRVRNESCVEQIMVLVAFTANTIIIAAFYFIQMKVANFPSFLSNKYNEETEVIRDGKRTRIPTEDIVVGDLVVLRYGEIVPADVRIVENQNFKVDNFTLSGYHEPRTLQERSKKENPFESNNIAFYSTKIVEGSATGIVIRTGKNTFLGNCFSPRLGNGRVICPVTMMVMEYLNVLAAFSVVASAILFLICYVKDKSLSDTIMLITMLTISIMPENLFIAMLLSYKIQCKKLSMKNYCAIMSIKALQKLPFVNVICIDRTGFMTEKKLTVSYLWFDRKVVEVWGGTKMVLKDRTSVTFKELTRCAVLCNEEDVKTEQTEQQSEGHKHVVGNGVEAAVLRFLSSTLGKKVERFRETYPKIWSRPYSINGRYHISVHKTEDGISVILMGDPEYLLDKCTGYYMQGMIEPINSGFFRDIDKACVAFSGEGSIIRCVITITITEYDDDFILKIPDTGYTFLGLFTFSELSPIGMTDAIGNLKRAGIKVILMTNNHPIASKKIARTMGVISEQSRTLEERIAEGRGDYEDIKAAVVDGNQLKTYSLQGTATIIQKHEEVVFARMLPVQNLMVVAACQRTGALVAVVGNVNDCMSVKKADVKIILTEEKTEASEEKPDIYTTDESFTAMVSLILESRAVFENIKKCNAYLMSSNMAKTLPVLVHLLAGLPLPINAMGLIIIEVVFQFFPSIALIFERPDPMMMKRPPPDLRTERIWSRPMVFYSYLQIGALETATCFFTYFLIMYEFGWSPISLIGARSVWNAPTVTDLEDTQGQNWSYDSRKELEIIAQTGYFFTLVLMQCVNVMICRNQRLSSFRNLEHNWVIPFSVLFELSLVLFLIYLPTINELVKMRSIRPVIWMVPMPFCMLIFVYDEWKKYVVRKHPKGWVARETIY
ncbi:UNVERIFIED_CONTAM: hypothetical protein PYX00_003853 [Menopon gallinae]|uniref:Cation-transporting P-type ATPase N-terminal domain-containing protein n=1 Tax=Menopon gallinae TaxID=328185 RepID=A0AAW2I263_9NEOP